MGRKELDLSGQEAILDLGCGDGKLTAQIAELVPKGKVVGIDASPGMIETAKERETDNLSFRLQNINGLDYQSEFDVIVSGSIVEMCSFIDENSSISLTVTVR